MYFKLVSFGQHTAALCCSIGHGVGWHPPQTLENTYISESKYQDREQAGVEKWRGETKTICVPKFCQPVQPSLP